MYTRTAAKLLVIVLHEVTITVTLQYDSLLTKIQNNYFMINPFKFANLPQIIFRSGSISELPQWIRKYGDPVLLVTGKSSFTRSERGKKLLQAIKENEIAYSHIKISGEPSPAAIDKAVNENRGKNIKLVIAIGGGSVMDAGKAISAMLREEKSVKDYLEGVGRKKPSGNKIPFIAIPTTSGTGSEATKNAVISEVGSNGFKKSLRHDQYVPDIALIDPELTLECPAEITAAAGMDCFTQLTEAFLSVNATDYTDAFARLGLKAIEESLVKAVKDGVNIEHRANMSFAALNSGICLANAGLGTIHGFASPIGAKFDIPHGVVCGTLMAASNRLTVKELRKNLNTGPFLRKYAELGNIFIKECGKPSDFYIDGFIDYLYQLTDELQIPLLSEYGFKENNIKDISENTGNKNNPVKLGKEELEEVLRERV